MKKIDGQNFKGFADAISAKFPKKILWRWVKITSLISIISILFIPFIDRGLYDEYSNNIDIYILILEEHSKYVEIDKSLNIIIVTSSAILAVGFTLEYFIVDKMFNEYPSSFIRKIISKKKLLLPYFVLTTIIFYSLLITLFENYIDQFVKTIITIWIVILFMITLWKFINLHVELFKFMDISESINILKIKILNIKNINNDNIKFQLALIELMNIINNCINNNRTQYSREGIDSITEIMEQIIKSNNIELLYDYKFLDIMNLMLIKSFDNKNPEIASHILANIIVLIDKIAETDNILILNNKKFLNVIENMLFVILKHDSKIAININIIIEKITNKIIGSKQTTFLEYIEFSDSLYDIFIISSKHSEIALSIFFDIEKITEQIIKYNDVNLSECDKLLDKLYDVFTYSYENPKIMKHIIILINKIVKRIIESDDILFPNIKFLDNINKMFNKLPDDDIKSFTYLLRVMTKFINKINKDIFLANEDLSVDIINSYYNKLQKLCKNMLVTSLQSEKNDKIYLLVKTNMRIMEKLNISLMLKNSDYDKYESTAHFIYSQLFMMLRQVFTNNHMDLFKYILQNFNTHLLYFDVGTIRSKFSVYGNILSENDLDEINLGIIESINDLEKIRNIYNKIDNMKESFESEIDLYFKYILKRYHFSNLMRKLFFVTGKYLFDKPTKKDFLHILWDYESTLAKSVYPDERLVDEDIIIWLTFYLFGTKDNLSPDKGAKLRYYSLLLLKSGNAFSYDDLNKLKSSNFHNLDILPHYNIDQIKSCIVDIKNSFHAEILDDDKIKKVEIALQSVKKPKSNTENE